MSRCSARWLLMPLLALPACSSEPPASGRPSLLPTALSGAEEALASSAGNVLPVAVGGDLAEVNVPYVSVTLCEPGTTVCQTIPHVQLDTGSSGLRLDARLVTLTLPPVTDAAGHAVGDCASYGGGDAYWGAVVTADVVMGDETAAGVSVQTIDASWSKAPNTCAGKATMEAVNGYNGVLGIGPALSAPTLDAYYSCAGTCTATSAPAAPHDLENPVARLPRHHNGLVLTFPPVPAGGATELTGAMILGLGTESNNTPPEAGLVTLQTDAQGWLQARLGDVWHYSMIDSGTNSYDLPTSYGPIPSCGAGDPYLCPPTPLTLAVDVAGADQVPRATVALGIADAAPLESSSTLVYADLGEQWGGDTATTVILGLPFFFGRSVYIGLAGESGPLGVGPLVAYH